MLHCNIEGDLFCTVWTNAFCIFNDGWDSPGEKSHLWSSILLYHLFVTTTNPTNIF